MAHFEEIPRWIDYTKDFELRLKTPIRSGNRDWVGLFPVGWKSLADYVTYIMVRGLSVLCFVPSTFPRDKNVESSFQFVYVNSEGEVVSTTPPFQFQSSTSDALESFVYVQNDDKTERSEILLESRGVGTSMSGSDGDNIWKKAFENERKLTHRQELKYAELESENSRLVQRVGELETEVARLSEIIDESARKIVKPPDSIGHSLATSLDEQPIVYPPVYRPPGVSFLGGDGDFHCPICQKMFPESMGTMGFQQHVNLHFWDTD